MRNELKQRWKLLLFTGIFCLIAIIAWLFFSPKETNNTTTEISEAPLESRRVYIKDFHLYQDDHEHDTDVHAHGSIENTLYTYVARDTPGLYTGVIREDSFKETSATTAELLVDIEPGNTTYLIKLINPDKKGYKPYSIACAPDNQQMNSDIECIDEGLPL